jgi:NADH-quinone oxidoreductase subunit J
MVYVGGIALLFLFVIIMLNLKIDYNTNKKSFRLLSGHTILFLVFLKIQSFLALQVQYLTPSGCLNMKHILKVHHFFSNDILNFGLLMYTHYFFNFLLAGVILLIAMVSVLILSLNNIKNK